MDFAALKTYILELLHNDLSGNLSYHAVHHTVDVLHAVEKLAAAEGINKQETLLIKTAALLHDAGFLIQYNCNEPLACDLAETLLPKFGFTSNEISTIRNMIMATEVPQKPQNNLEKIICDADLDYLGRPDFFSISEQLRKELKSHGKNFTDKEWLKFEIDFLDKHNYFTKTAQTLRNKLKLQHLEELKKQFATLERK